METDRYIQLTLGGKLDRFKRTLSTSLTCRLSLMFFLLLRAQKKNYTKHTNPTWDHFRDRPFLFRFFCQVQSVLGLELLECLYWRRGALLYMYCHTLHQRKQWIKKNKGTFLKVGLQNNSFSTSSHSAFVKAFGQ